MFCPACRSKRFRRYGRRDDEFFCPACKKVLRIEELEVPSCYKCGRVIDDYSKAVRMGNNKDRHVRCKSGIKKENDNAEGIGGQEYDTRKGDFGPVVQDCRRRET